MDDFHNDFNKEIIECSLCKRLGQRRVLNSLCTQQNNSACIFRESKTNGLIAKYVVIDEFTEDV